MKTTEHFKTVISNHLNMVAQKDSLFKDTLQKENKNIDDCITYILNEVKNSGCNGFADEEIFNMAIHYYDEDNINIGEKITANIVVNHSVELTEEEIKKAKKDALDKIIQDEQKKILNKKPSKRQK